MRPRSQGFYLLGGESYQREFLHSELLDKTLDVSDESFHVVSIDPVWLPRLVVSSEGQNLEDENLEEENLGTWRRQLDSWTPHIDGHHPMCLLEMSNLVPPSKPFAKTLIQK